MKIYKKRTKHPILKWCDRCNKTHGLKLFPPDRDGQHGRGNICNYCLDIDKTEKKKELQKENYKIKLRRESTTIEHLHEIYEFQNGCCSICKTEYPITSISKRGGLYIDHCHDTGKIRGLLCPKCNSGLGIFKDDIKLLETAIDYIKRCGDNTKINEKNTNC